jgi:hypothetical protein
LEDINGLPRKKNRLLVLKKALQPSFGTHSGRTIP